MAKSREDLLEIHTLLCELREEHADSMLWPPVQITVDKMFRDRAQLKIPHGDLLDQKELQRYDFEKTGGALVLENWSSHIAWKYKKRWRKKYAKYLRKKEGERLLRIAIRKTYGYHGIKAVMLERKTVYYQAVGTVITRLVRGFLGRCRYRHFLHQQERHDKLTERSASKLQSAARMFIVCSRSMQGYAGINWKRDRLDIPDGCMDGILSGEVENLASALPRAVAAALGVDRDEHIDGDAVSLPHQDIDTNGLSTDPLDVLDDPAYGNDAGVPLPRVRAPPLSTNMGKLGPSSELGLLDPASAESHAGRMDMMHPGNEEKQGVELNENMRDGAEEIAEIRGMYTALDTSTISSHFDSTADEEGREEKGADDRLGDWNRNDEIEGQNHRDKGDDEDGFSFFNPDSAYTEKPLILRRLRLKHRKYIRWRKPARSIPLCYMRALAKWHPATKNSAGVGFLYIKNVVVGSEADEEVSVVKVGSDRSVDTIGLKKSVEAKRSIDGAPMLLYEEDLLFFLRPWQIQEHERDREHQHDPQTNTYLTQAQTQAQTEGGAQMLRKVPKADVVDLISSDTGADGEVEESGYRRVPADDECEGESQEERPESLPLIENSIHDVNCINARDEIAAGVDMNVHIGLTLKPKGYTSRFDFRQYEPVRLAKLRERLLEEYENRQVLALATKKEKPKNWRSLGILRNMATGKVDVSSETDDNMVVGAQDKVQGGGDNKAGSTAIEARQQLADRLVREEEAMQQHVESIAAYNRSYFHSRRSSFLFPRMKLGDRTALGTYDELVNRVKSLWRRYKAKRFFYQMLLNKNIIYVLRIQHWYLGWRRRREVQRAVGVIQPVWRSRIAQHIKRKHASAVIHNIWKMQTTRRLFKKMQKRRNKAIATLQQSLCRRRLLIRHNREGITHKRHLFELKAAGLALYKQTELCRLCYFFWQGARKPKFDAHHELQKCFSAYALNGNLELGKLIKFVKDCKGILLGGGNTSDGDITINSIELEFAKIKLPTEKRIDYAKFTELLKILAVARFIATPMKEEREREAVALQAQEEERMVEKQRSFYALHGPHGTAATAGGAEADDGMDAVGSLDGRGDAESDYPDTEGKEEHNLSTWGSNSQTVLAGVAAPGTFQGVVEGEGGGDEGSLGTAATLLSSTRNQQQQNLEFDPSNRPDSRASGVGGSSAAPTARGLGVTGAGQRQPSEEMIEEFQYGGLTGKPALITKFVLSYVTTNREYIRSASALDKQKKSAQYLSQMQIRSKVEVLQTFAKNRLGMAELTNSLKRTFHAKIDARRYAAAKRIQGMVKIFLTRRFLMRMAQHMYTKFVDAESGKDYWYNSRTGNSFWQKPTLLGIYDCGMATKMPLPDEKYEVVCSVCETTTASCFCDDCQLPYCTADYALAHRGGKRKGHKHIVIDNCVQCEFQLATRECKNCKDMFCDSCYQYVHRRGRLRFHVFQRICDACEECDERSAQWKETHVPTASAPGGPPSAADHLEGYFTKLWCNVCYRQTHSSTVVGDDGEQRTVGVGAAEVAQASEEFAHAIQQSGADYASSIASAVAAAGMESEITATEGYDIEGEGEHGWEAAAAAAQRVRVLAALGGGDAAGARSNGLSFLTRIHFFGRSVKEHQAAQLAEERKRVADDAFEARKEELQNFKRLKAAKTIQRVVRGFWKRREITPFLEKRREFMRLRKEEAGKRESALYQFFAAVGLAPALKSDTPLEKVMKMYPSYKHRVLAECIEHNWSEACRLVIEHEEHMENSEEAQKATIFQKTAAKMALSRAKSKYTKLAHSLEVKEATYDALRNQYDMMVSGGARGAQALTKLKVALLNAEKARDLAAQKCKEQEQAAIRAADRVDTLQGPRGLPRLVRHRRRHGLPLPFTVTLQRNSRLALVEWLVEEEEEEEEEEGEGHVLKKTAGYELRGKAEGKHKGSSGGGGGGRRKSKGFGSFSSGDSADFEASQSPPMAATSGAATGGGGAGKRSAGRGKGGRGAGGGVYTGLRRRTESGDSAFSGDSGLDALSESTFSAFDDDGDHFFELRPGEWKEKLQIGDVILINGARFVVSTPNRSGAQRARNRKPGSGAGGGDNLYDMMARSGHSSRPTTARSKAASEAESGGAGSQKDAEQGGDSNYLVQREEVYTEDHIQLDRPWPLADVYNIEVFKAAPLVFYHKLPAFLGRLALRSYPGQKGTAISAICAHKISRLYTSFAHWFDEDSGSFAYLTNQAAKYEDLRDFLLLRSKTIVTMSFDFTLRRRLYRTFFSTPYRILKLLFQVLRSYLKSISVGNETPYEIWEKSLEKSEIRCVLELPDNYAEQVAARLAHGEGAGAGAGAAGPGVSGLSAKGRVRPKQLGEFKMDVNAPCDVMREYVERAFREQLNESVGDSFLFFAVIQPDSTDPAGGSGGEGGGAEPVESVLGRDKEEVTYSKDYTMSKTDKKSLIQYLEVTLVPDKEVPPIMIPEFKAETADNDDEELERMATI